MKISDPVVTLGILRYRIIRYEALRKCPLFETESEVSISYRQLSRTCLAMLPNEATWFPGISKRMFPVNEISKKMTNPFLKGASPVIVFILSDGPKKKSFWSVIPIWCQTRPEHKKTRTKKRKEEEVAERAFLNLLYTTIHFPDSSRGEKKSPF